ncbi:unnamed protein product [Microthlaspi erraticum]|uniref:Reverse transcriptase domain-containing protein n=1 Tax=Microthlaspi erraticum TaxID=1685480 RepID=A0A6D2JWU3_9BRAS|nr:unnamed protein product [Microthlaspi erraticum]
MLRSGKLLPNRDGSPQINVDIDGEEGDDLVEFENITAPNSIEPESNHEPELNRASEPEPEYDKAELDRVTKPADRVSPSLPAKSVSKKKDTPFVPPAYKPPLPFPGRFKKQLMEKHKAIFDEIMKEIDLKLPFIDALMLIPPYKKFLKDAVLQRTKEAQGMVVLSHECSAIIQRKAISDKKKDPESFTLPCTI